MFIQNRSSFILLALTFILSFYSIFVGAISISLDDILSLDADALELLFLSRFPRLIACLLSGMSLAVAGLIMQSICMNKFVSPSTAATLSSAQFGILIALLCFENTSLLERSIFTFAFSMLGTFLFVSFILKTKFKDIIIVPLIGVMFSNIIGGITTFIAFDNNMSQAISSYIVGHFSLVIKGNYEIVYLNLPLLILALLFASKFNIASLGANFCKNLGLNYKFILFIGLTLASALCASIVVTVGTIPYVGLIIPNLVAIFKGDNLKNSLVDTALLGGIFVLLCDIISRTIVYPYEIAINIIVGVLGSLIFILLIFYKLRDKKYEDMPLSLKLKNLFKININKNNLPLDKEGA